MQQINSILEKKKFTRIPGKTNRKENPVYNDALRFKEIFNIPLNLSFRLIKTYGVAKLDDVVSWWSDYPFKRKDNTPLLFWKLKEMRRLK